MNKNKKMKNFNVRVCVQACYDTIIEVPEDYSQEDAIEIAENQLNNLPLGELSYIQGSDEIDPSGCYFIKGV